jgi:hypothetical protein
MNRNEELLNNLAQKINGALRISGYRPEEATARYWSKEVKPGIVIERLYLGGKKANGFIEINPENDVPVLRESKFMQITHIVSDAIKL